MEQQLVCQSGAGTLCVKPIEKKRLLLQWVLGIGSALWNSVDGTLELADSELERGAISNSI